MYNVSMEKLSIDSRYIEDVKRAVQYLKEVGCTEIYIFGSVVTGGATSSSDLDIAVKGIPAEKFFDVYGALMFLLDHKVDLIDLQLQERFGEILIRSEEILRVA